MKKSVLALTLGLLTGLFATDLNIYGAGGPAPVIRELAKLFQEKTGKEISITAGPTPTWQDKAKKDADLFFSGSSLMMNDFADIFSDKINIKDIKILNARESGILVRPNNPKKIHSFTDILKEEISIIVVDGSGQPGLWEDMALKNGKITNLEKLRKNIRVFAKNSREALQAWNNDKNIDALIIWKHWENSQSKFIPAGKSNVIHRASEIVVAKDSKNKKIADEFVEFLQSKPAQKVWLKEGWMSR